MPFILVHPQCPQPPPHCCQSGPGKMSLLFNILRGSRLPLSTHHLTCFSGTPPTWPTLAHSPPKSSLFPTTHHHPEEPHSCIPVSLCMVPPLPGMLSVPSCPTALPSPAHKHHSDKNCVWVSPPPSSPPCLDRLTSHPCSSAASFCHSLYHAGLASLDRGHSEGRYSA